MIKKKLFSIFCLVAGVILLVTGTHAVHAATLTAYEIESLMFVREEEKLARDTYLTLYGTWEMNIFQTIAESEQNHMDAILGLLDKYNLEDPASSVIGEFQNDFLQTKYTELITWGAESQADALLVGCLIEEIDLVDLAERMAEIKHKDILTVFQNLKDGSENHLRAFVASFESLTGETYTPVLLDQSIYQAIINASSDSGSNGSGNSFGGGGFRGGQNGGDNSSLGGGI